MLKIKLVSKRKLITKVKLTKDTFVQQKIKTMKRDNIIYWVTTGMVAMAMAFSSYMYLSKNPELMNNFKTLGYPEYFVSMLGIAKLLGAIALLIPALDKIKEWAYAGFTFTFIGATYTHIATNTPFVGPIIILIVLGISYWFRGRLKIQTGS